jgi:hypothetical protein
MHTSGNEGTPPLLLGVAKWRYAGISRLGEQRPVAAGV